MKASIIICTYNRADLLRDSIKSVQAQDFPADQFEIIVVDNNSTDDTREIVEKLADSSPVKIRYIFEGRLGLSFARNTGIANAEGEIIAFTDDDIDAEKQWLKEIIAAFDDDPEVYMAGGPIRPVWPFEKPEWLTENLFGYLSVNEFEQAKKAGEYKDYADYPWGANMAFRKEVFTNMGLFPEQLGRVGNVLLSNEEVQFCRKARANGKIVMFAADAVINHKIIPSRLNKLWFYHRTYWQGRSDALLDKMSHTYPYSKLRETARETLFRRIGSPEERFDYKCFRRSDTGYLYQLILPAEVSGVESDFRRLRAIKTFTEEIVKSSVRLLSERDQQLAEKNQQLEERDQQLAEKNQQLEEKDRQLAEKDRQLAERDQQLAEKDRQLEEKDRQIELFKQSFSWRMMAPFRWVYDLMKKIT